jgi:anti-anti-sigma factor
MHLLELQQCPLWRILVFCMVWRGIKNGENAELQDDPALQEPVAGIGFSWLAMLSANRKGAGFSGETMRIHNREVAGFCSFPNDPLYIRLCTDTGAPGCLVLELKGYADNYNASALHENFSKTLDAGYRRIILDLKEFEYFSSAFPAFLTEIKAIRTHGGRLVLLNASEGIIQVYKLLGLYELFYFANTIEQASAACQTGNSASGPFPVVLSCGNCKSRVMVRRVGIFQCPRCGSTFSVTEKGDAIRAEVDTPHFSV